MRKSQARQLVANAASQGYLIGVMLVLIYVGAVEAFGPYPVPPEVAGAFPSWLVRSYGGWLLIGAITVIVGTTWRYRAWAVMLERAGHLAIATAMAFFAALITYAYVHQDGSDADLTAGHYAGLLAFSLLILAASLTRRVWLGRCVLPHTHKRSGKDAGRNV